MDARTREEGDGNLRIQPAARAPEPAVFTLAERLHTSGRACSCLGTFHRLRQLDSAMLIALSPRGLGDALLENPRFSSTLGPNKQQLWVRWVNVLLWVCGFPQSVHTQVILKLHDPQPH